MEEDGDDDERYSWISATPDRMWFQRHCMICGEYVTAASIERIVIMEFLVFDAYTQDVVVKSRPIKCTFHPSCEPKYCAKARGA